MKKIGSFLILLLFFSLLGAQETLPIKTPREQAWEGLKRLAFVEVYRHGKVEKFQIAEYIEDLGYMPNKRSITVFITKLEEREPEKSYRNYTILRANFQNISLGTVLYTLAKLMEKNVIFGKELLKESTERKNIAEVKVYNVQKGATARREGKEQQQEKQVAPQVEAGKSDSTSSQENLNETIDKRVSERAELIETYSVSSYLLQPINLVIERPIRAYTLFRNILKEYNLMAIRLSGNLIKVGIKDTIEFSLNTDDKKVVSDFIKQLKMYVSPAAHIVYDKALRKVIVTDLKENIERLRSLRDDFYSMLHRKTKEQKKEEEKIASRVFYFPNKRDLELAKSFIRENFGNRVSFSEDKDFNALIVVGDRFILENLAQRLESISSDSAKTRSLTSRVFYVRYITPQKLKKLIEPMLSEEGEVYILTSQDIYKEEDFEKDKVSIKGASGLEENAFADIAKERESKISARNILLIRDYPERIEEIYKKFKKFLSDKPIRIIIRARFLEVQKNVLRELGFNWKLLFSKAHAPYFWSGNASLEPTFAGTQGLFTFTLQRGRLNLLDLKLKAYERENLARNLAEPYVLTTNGEPAIVASGLEWPVFRLNITQQLTQITWRYINIPITLIATPIVLPDDTIVLDITLARKQIVDFFRFPVTQDVTQDIPILSSSRIDIKVPVKNGETIVIAGILEKASSDSEEGIPGLRRIPLLGWLFKTQTKELRDKELLIFLTPEIVEE
ncbi:type II secretion system protein GspD [Aquifex sp.]